MPVENQRVGEYVLLQRVGRGACGEVWRARHHMWAGKEAAVKMPTDPAFVHALRREGMAVHGLAHPNIVGAINFDPFADPPYLVMEYVPGTSLRALLKQGPLRPDDAVAVARHVLRALHHAHARGVIHRDVKPENILIHRSARQAGGLAAAGALKLSDFGLSRATTAAAASGSIVLSGPTATATAAVAGTRLYMAPEQLDGVEIDGRADLYACGVVLFEMLTGQRPAGHEVPSDLDPSVPTHLNDAFRRAHARRERRFPTAREFYDALAAPTSAADKVEAGTDDAAAVAVVSAKPGRGNAKAGGPKHANRRRRRVRRFRRVPRPSLNDVVAAGMLIAVAAALFDVVLISAWWWRGYANEIIEVRRREGFGAAWWQPVSGNDLYDVATTSRLGNLCVTMAVVAVVGLLPFLWFKVLTTEEEPPEGRS